MWDKKTLINLFALALYVSGFNFYLYELFYGSWNTLQAKGFFYIITVSFLTYIFFISKYTGQTTYLSEQFDLISKLTVLINFIIIVLTLYDLLNNHRTYFYTFNGSILVTTIMVTFSGFKHGIFKE